MRWPARRAAHVTVAAATVTGLLLVTAMTDARFEPAAIVLRNTTGLFGLTALSAALVGAARSWIAPLAWTLITLLPQIGPSERLEMQIAGWLIQPTDTTAAIIERPDKLLSHLIFDLLLRTGFRVRPHPTV